MFKLVLEKAEEPEIKLTTSVRSSKKQESSRETSISALLTMPKPLWGSQQTVENSERDGNTRHLTCLLRNLYAGLKATIRTGHGTTDWFQIGKGVYQGYILSPCLFNLASLVAQTVKCLPAMRETWARFLCREDPLEKEMTIYSSTLAWKIPWMEEPDRLQSVGHKESGTTE